MNNSIYYRASSIILLFVLIICSFSVVAFNTNYSESAFIYDTTPPVTKYSIEGEKFFRNYIGEITITFTASDDESGVKETWIGFHLGGGAMMWQRYENPIIISNIGVKTLDYWSKDNAGNVEDSKTLSVSIVEDLGYLFAIGDFEESVTRFSGDYLSMIFIGFIDKEFKIITDYNENLIIEKGRIIKEIISTSKILFLKIAKLPE